MLQTMFTVLLVLACAVYVLAGVLPRKGVLVLSRWLRPIPWLGKHLSRSASAGSGCSNCAACGSCADKRRKAQ